MYWHQHQQPQQQQKIDLMVETSPQTPTAFMCQKNINVSTHTHTHTHTHTAHVHLNRSLGKSAPKWHLSRFCYFGRLTVVTSIETHRHTEHSTSGTVSAGDAGQKQHKTNPHEKRILLSLVTTYICVLINKQINQSSEELREINLILTSNSSLYLFRGP